MADANANGRDLDEDRCLACGEVLRDGDLVLCDVSGDLIHGACCGPERESYCNLESGAPLGPDEALPTPWPYRKELSSARGTTTSAQTELLGALNHPFLNELLGLVEDGTDHRAWSMAKLWMDTRDAAIAKATTPDPDRTRPDPEAEAAEGGRS